MAEESTREPLTEEAEEEVKAVELTADEKKFLVACAAGNKVQIEMLIKKGLNTNLKSAKFGLQPLHLVCGAGAVDCAKILVASGADVKAADPMGLTPLHWVSSPPWKRNAGRSAILLAPAGSQQGRSREQRLGLNRRSAEAAIRVSQLSTALYSTQETFPGCTAGLSNYTFSLLTACAPRLATGGGLPRARDDPLIIGLRRLRVHQCTRRGRVDGAHPRRLCKPARQRGGEEKEGNPRLESIGEGEEGNLDRKYGNHVAFADRPGNGVVRGEKANLACKVLVRGERATKIGNHG
jgi:hypothetical protein